MNSLYRDASKEEVAENSAGNARPFELESSLCLALRRCKHVEFEAFSHFAGPKFSA